MINTIVFGGGCFWCTEAVFKMLNGVSSVEPGYAGGTTKNPTYDAVSAGITGHTEVVRIEYDPVAIPFEKLLTIFFATHDPTTLNRQGNDVGTQYRSAVYYTTDVQKAATEAFIRDINASARDGRPVVTEVKALEDFYPAEDYHKNYFERNQEAPYCQIVINPKLEKVQRAYAELLKKR